jgi:hypothetical protein
MEKLLDRIRSRITTGRPCDEPDMWLNVKPPVNTQALAMAEAELGFALPNLLRSLYSEVGNCGYGPVFGLIPLSVASCLGDTSEFDLVSGYLQNVRRYANDPAGPWPFGLVPVFYFGCPVFEFVNCCDPTGPVIGFDQDSMEVAELRSGQHVVAASLQARLESWLADEPVQW